MTENMPILYRNAMDALPSDFARDVFLWAVERPVQDKLLYRAEAFAREVDQLASTTDAILDLANWSIFKSKKGILLDEAAIDDLKNFILTRHANLRYGGNLRPSYA